MAWEREYHHIDLDESQHTIGLVDRSVTTMAGQPARYLIHIKMGDGPLEYQVGTGVGADGKIQPRSVRVHLGGDLVVQKDGTLKDSEGNVFDPRDFEQKMIEKLNAHHAALRTYARKHGAPEYKGPSGKSR
jgi:hypothetical protein